MADFAPPPGPKPPRAPLVPPGPGAMRSVAFEGTVQLYTSGMPETSFVDFSDSGTHPVFVCCWVDKQRGKVTHVSYDGNTGKFGLELVFRDNDPDKLKIQVCMRMLDTDTGNRRTVQLSTSCAFMDTMLQGKNDEFQMPDQFIKNNYARVTMRIVNHQDFLSTPLRLRPSALNRIPELNEKFRAVGQYMADNVKQNQTKITRGSESMISGESRYYPHVFLALCLGVPAYAFLSVQP
jgi:hypothetical protein